MPGGNPTRTRNTSNAPPLYVPLLLVAWGMFLWLKAGRKMVRDPRGEIWKMAESRSKNRFLKFTGQARDPETEFQNLWKIRWVLLVVAVAYSAVTLLFFVEAVIG